MISVSFAISNAKGTILSGSEELADAAAIERFISTTLPGWAEVLRKQESSDEATVTVAEAPEVLPQTETAKML